MRRREWLGMVGAAVLSGCGEEAAPRPATPAVPPSPSVSDPAPPAAAATPEAPPPSPEESAPEETTPATDADWARLAEQLDGELVRPSHDRYAEAKRLFDPRFDSLRPEGVAYARSESDVQRLIAFARAHAVPFAARCGGHSYGGYSSGPGLVCDVGPMAEVSVDGTRATIGAGAKLIDIYAALAPRRRVIPGGTCPSVGVSGLTLGGGQGVFGRALD